MKPMRPPLLYVPDPILDESPASWMVRLCQYHELWPNRLRQLFGISKMADFDIDLQLTHLLALTHGTAIGREKLVCLDRKFSQVRESTLAQLFLLYTKQQLPFYRYCPECLASDPVPYWRLTWRMAHVHICPIHFSRMLNRCLECGQFIGAVQSVHSRFGGGECEPFCRYCPSCDHDLGGFIAEKIGFTQRARDIVSLQRVVTAALIRGHFFVQDIDGALPLKSLPRALLMGAGPRESVEPEAMNLAPFVLEFLEDARACSDEGQITGRSDGKPPLLFNRKLLLEIRTKRWMRTARRWRFSQPIIKILHPEQNIPCWLEEI